MARKNRNPHPRRIREKSAILKGYDRDYVNLPEYAQYRTITAVPLKTVFENLDADPRANDFYVARSYGDPVMKKLARRITAEVIA